MGENNNGFWLCTRAYPFFKLRALEVQQGCYILAKVFYKSICPSKREVYPLSLF